MAEVVKGMGWVQQEGRKQELHEGDVVYEGDIILTQKKRMKIRLWQRLTTLEIKKNSELEIVSRSIFKVLKGDVKSKIYAAEPVVFETPIVRFGAYGTEFLVRVKPDTTYVGVSEGEIKVRHLESESEQMTTLSPNLMLRATSDDPLKIAPLPKKSSTPKWITIGACAAAGIGGYLLIDHYAGGSPSATKEIKSLQDAINAADYVIGHLETADSFLVNLSTANVDSAQDHIDFGNIKVKDIRDGGKEIRKSMQKVKYGIAALAAVVSVYSTVRLFQDRDVYRGIEDRKWWVSFKPDLLGEDPSMKLALNVKF
ncbi:MAG: FecR domain-containing protein [Gemmatimonadota bacterium]|nr:MAG: FecR domain-containing protein [Gemmatimonadota bacterium]